LAGDSIKEHGCHSREGIDRGAACPPHVADDKASSRARVEI
jgi:hypothetical protein